MAKAARELRAPRVSHSLPRKLMHLPVVSDATLGAASALGTALVWSIATLLFKKSGERLGAVALNYFKNGVGLLLLAATLVATGASLPAETPAADVLILLASGVVGIAIADSLFFSSLNVLGAGRSAIIDCLYAPFVVGFSTVWLNESLSWRSGLGGALVIAAVAMTSTRVASLDVPRRHLWLGVFYGALAMALTAAAIVGAKPVLERYPVLWSTSVRLLGGFVALTLYALLHPPTRRVAFAAFVPQPAWRYALPGAVAGAYLAIVLWVAGFKYTSATTAAMLNQTSTVLVVVLAAVFLHERLTPMHAGAAVLAFVGSALILG